MSRDEWLQERTKGIGGTDAAAIAGLNPWKSPMQVWLEKTGQMESPDLTDNDAVYWGMVLEDIVAKEFAKRTGMWVQRRNTILIHPEHKFMIGNVDRLIRPEKGKGAWGVLECKTTSEWNKDQWSDEEIPPHYLIQVQHYLAVTGFSYGYIAVLIGGQSYKHLKVERDETIINNLITIERNFWENNVIKCVPPPWDGSESSSELLKKFYPHSKPEEIELSAEAEKDIQAYNEAVAAMKDWEQIKNEAENKLKGMLGDNERGRIGKMIVSWKSITTNRLDTKALQKDHPDIYEQYTKESSYRRFSIK